LYRRRGGFSTLANELTPCYARPAVAVVPPGRMRHDISEDRIFEDVDSRVRAAGVSPNAGYRHWSADVRTELEDSWAFILDPTNYGRYESWQATVHALHADDVVQAVRIEG
jgi:hypothetical protein